MKYYAKILNESNGSKRLHVEIWETSLIDESKYDKKIQCKMFFRFSSAKKWAENKIFELSVKDSSHVFIIDDNITRRNIQ